MLVVENWDSDRFNHHVARVGVARSNRSDHGKSVRVHVLLSRIQAVCQVKPGQLSYGFGLNKELLLRFRVLGQFLGNLALSGVVHVRVVQGYGFVAEFLFSLLQVLYLFVQCRCCLVVLSFFDLCGHILVNSKHCEI